MVGEQSKAIGRKPMVLPSNRRYFQWFMVVLFGAFFLFRTALSISERMHLNGNGPRSPRHTVSRQSMGHRPTSAVSGWNTIVPGFPFRVRHERVQAADVR